MTIALYCVFAISVGNSGILRSHTMTPNEIDHMADINFRADHAADPASYEIAALQAYKRRLCRAYFGRVPDLVWTRGTRR